MTAFNERADGAYRRRLPLVHSKMKKGLSPATSLLRNVVGPLISHHDGQTPESRLDGREEGAGLWLLNLELHTFHALRPLRPLRAVPVFHMAASKPDYSSAPFPTSTVVPTHTPFPRPWNRRSVPEIEGPFPVLDSMVLVGFSKAKPCWCVVFLVLCQMIRYFNASPVQAEMRLWPGQWKSNFYP
jgi:hypothetical protein